MPRTLYLIDGHSQIYRAYYAPFRDLTSPSGEPTRATYVFCQMLLNLLADRRPDYIAMAVDGPAEELRRREAYPQYKANRPPAPEDFLPQEQRIFGILETIGLPILRAKGHEADDILATAVRRFAGPDLDVVMVSRDKDLDQLVGEHAVLYDPMKDETYGPAEIEQAKGYTPAQAVEVQALMGDKTDNVPGVPGIGPKTAASLIAKYGTAEGVLAHAAELTRKQRENVEAHAADLRVSRQLVELDAHVPIELDVDAMRRDRVDVRRARATFEELGFNRLLDQLDRLGDPAGRPDAPAATSAVEVAARRGETSAADFDYRCVDTPEGLDELAGQLASVQRLAVDTETTSVLPMFADLVGLSLAWEPGRGVYLPVRGPLGAKTLDVELVREKLGGVLADESVEKIGQNLKYDVKMLARSGMEVRGPIFDTMVAAHVLDATRPTLKLDALAMEYLGHRCVPIEELIGRGKKQISMAAVAVETVTPYAAEDADVALRLADVLAPKLREEGLHELFADLEMPLLPVLAEMELRGIAVDPQALKRMEAELSRRADELRDRIVETAGRAFNVDSPKQLAEVLFTDLGLPVIKRRKTGPSTDAGVLEELAIGHELPGLVLDYRQLTKLLGTYLSALGDCIHPETHRIHTSFNQAGTATGRLSSSDPNLQNIPVRTEVGRRIRSAFVAPPGSVLLSADYSQVELRVLAHFCRDETLRDAFAHDADIHRIVAAEVFQTPPEEVTPEQRSRAKTVNFGIIYGQTAFGLARTLRIPRGEAAEFIAAYKARFPKIDEFLAECVEQAREHGYVETIFGRRRKIAEIAARNPQRRAAAERLAINSVVQGSAADLIKQAMVNLARRIVREGRPSRMLLQIHDELLFEVPEDQLEPEREMIVAEMTGAIELDVPLKVDVGTGLNWMAAK